MNDIFHQLTTLITFAKLEHLYRAALILFFGWIIARIVRHTLVSVFEKYTDAQGVMLIRTFSSYLIISIAVVMALNELGFDIGVLIGAAGILTVAIGFASQTSMSNLISGLFLLGERPFSVGDTIRIGETIGDVLSIDLLSVKMRTFDNLFVRIPNELLIKQSLTNYSRFSIRRLDISIKVSFKEDLEKLEKTLMDVSRRHPLCLVEPEPFYLVRGMGDFYIEVLLGLWTLQTNYLTLKNSIYPELLKELETQGINLPYPHRIMQYSEDSEIKR